MSTFFEYIRKVVSGNEGVQSTIVPDFDVQTLRVCDRTSVGVVSRIISMVHDGISGVINCVPNGGGLAFQVSGITKLTLAGNTIFALPALAVPAGGTAGAGITLSSTSNFGIFFGSGVPTLAAAQGSLYLRTDGNSTSTRAYINTDGGTTWTAITTAA